MKNYKVVCSVLIFCSVLLLTVGYSTFHRDINIDEVTAIVRPEKDIRISSIVMSQENSSSDVSSDYDYNVHSIFGNVTLPSASSYVTYEVKVLNISTNIYGLFEINNIPNGLDVQITNYELGDKLCDVNNQCDSGIYKTLYVKLAYKDGNNTTNKTEHTFNIDFLFDSVYDYNVDYAYTGDVQTFEAPANGKYKIQLWGASGGEEKTYHVMIKNQTTVVSRWPSTKGGYGAYTSGEIDLAKGTKLYIYVGQKGVGGSDYYNNDESNVIYDSSGNIINCRWTVFDIFNGGGVGATAGYDYYATAENQGYQRCGNRGVAGGGATDVRTVNGIWSDLSSLYTRIMVAAGGGGTVHQDYSVAGGVGYGGGLLGYTGGYSSYHGDINQYGTGGTQTSGGVAAVQQSVYGSIFDGSFGKGGRTDSISSGLGAGGGGGGYYGGGGGSGMVAGGHGNGGGSGSSFISGHNGCDAILDPAKNNSKIVHSGQSIHYSGYVFTSTEMIDGAGYVWTNEKGAYTGMPSYNTSSTMTGNIGDGYARITYVGFRG